MKLYALPMSFKKPFRAVPVTLGAHYARRQQKQQHIALARRLALTIGIPAMMGAGYWAAGPRAKEPTTIIADVETGMPQVETSTPVRYPRPMSAAELDAAQPGGSPSALASTARPAPTVSDSSWSYPNCGAARAAGAAPLYQGQPGYGPHMDGDHDGIACEPFYRP